jgi:hypothetical protein
LPRRGSPIWTRTASDEASRPCAATRFSAVLPGSRGARFFPVVRGTQKQGRGLCFRVARARACRFGTRAETGFQLANPARRRQ